MKLTANQIHKAIAWLVSNDGSTAPDGDRTACCAVAVYLEQLLERREAKEAGISIQYLRRIRKEQIGRASCRERVSSPV